MTAALTLWDVARSPLETAFREFHADNPSVYAAIVREALYLKRAGLDRCGIDLIFARLRWVAAVETRSDDGFRLNANHRAFYSRLVAHREVELREFFATRHQAHDGFDPASVTP